MFRFTSLSLNARQFCTNQRPLDERTATEQVKYKLRHLLKFLTQPTRARSILIMFGAYLVLAFSMYNWKTKITVGEQQVIILRLL